MNSYKIIWVAVDIQRWSSRITVIYLGLVQSDSNVNTAHIEHHIRTILMNLEIKCRC